MTDPEKIEQIRSELMQLGAAFLVRSVAISKPIYEENTELVADIVAAALSRLMISFYMTHSKYSEKSTPLQRLDASHTKALTALRRELERLKSFPEEELRTASSTVLGISEVNPDFDPEEFPYAAAAGHNNSGTYQCSRCGRSPQTLAMPNGMSASVFAFRTADGAERYGETGMCQDCQDRKPSPTMAATIQ